VLRGVGSGFTLVSEELGEEVVGDGGDGLHVVVDPIDGSLNAKRGIPLFALSIAVADGPAMGDVFFGYVLDFGTREEWTAVRGAGARLNDVRLDGPGPKDDVEILVIEATRTDLLADKVAGMVGLAYRTRVLGSLALALCHLAAGRVDAVCSLKPARSVDIAAAQLLVREQGLAVELPEDRPFDDARLDLAARSRVVAAPTSSTAWPSKPYGTRRRGTETAWLGKPSPSASSSWTTSVPRCGESTRKPIVLRNVPLHPVPHVAVVKVRAISFRRAFRIRSVTFASNTFAVPLTTSGLETLTSGGGDSTTIAGRRVS
jgi:myo-inositol-1(or 4)-monophosphatase